MIPPKAKTLAEVRQALRDRFQPPARRIVGLYDDSGDIDSLIKLIFPELAKRGIVPRSGS